MPKWDVHFATRVQTGHPEVIALNARAEALASVIRGIPLPPGVQSRLDALNILRAVRGTTGIEGAELSEEEVARIISAPPNKRVLPPNRRREELEARNAEELMRYVAEQLERDLAMPLTEELICRMHEITTNGISYPNNTPGQYRTHAVRAGDYIPPQTGEEVRRLMREFIRWYRKGPPARWDSIIRAIVAHFYVVSIHPFGDGNGRTARGVESFLLYQAQINARGFYSLANYFYRYRSEYVQNLDHVRFRTNGDLTPFVLFALRGLVEELNAVHAEVLSEVRVISFRDFARETLAIHKKLGTRVGERMFHFLLGLGHQDVSVKGLRTGKHPLSVFYRGVTNKTLARDLNFLKQQELIIVEGDNLKANLSVMTRFVPPHELLRKPKARRIAQRSRK